MGLQDFAQRRNMQAMPSKASTASATSAPSAQPERGPDARIAFQGAPGAYSDLACRDAFPQLEPLPCPDFEDALRAVQEKRARYAMIPIENSTAGRVADIHHLLPESGLAIIGEYAFLPVRHCLWGIPRRAARKGKTSAQPCAGLKPVPATADAAWPDANRLFRHSRRR